MLLKSTVQTRSFILAGQKLRIGNGHFGRGTEWTSNVIGGIAWEALRVGVCSRRQAHSV